MSFENEASMHKMNKFFRKLVYVAQMRFTPKEYNWDVEVIMLALYMINQDELSYRFNQSSLFWIFGNNMMRKLLISNYNDMRMTSEKHLMINYFNKFSRNLYNQERFIMWFLHFPPLCKFTFELHWNFKTLLRPLRKSSWEVFWCGRWVTD